jgi:DNA-binding IclR family transcriptional regulator
MENTIEKPSENYNAPNLEKGMIILELLATSNKAMTLNEITKASKVSQTTVYRILQTLVRLGYLLHNESSKRYKLSRKCLQLVSMPFRSRTNWMWYFPKCANYAMW